MKPSTKIAIVINCRCKRAVCDRLLHVISHKTRGEHERTSGTTRISKKHVDINNDNKINPRTNVPLRNRSDVVMSFKFDDLFTYDNAVVSDTSPAHRRGSRR